MKKITIVCLFGFSVAIATSCTSKNIKNESALKKVNTVWLDSIVKNSDSTFSKKYRTADFATAEYYLFKKDSSVCQVMKDTAKTIRQILVSKKNIRTYFAQYYANGQLIADVKLDNYGQPDGSATYYYETGKIMRAGKYRHGLAVEQWEEFDEKTSTRFIAVYDSNGVRKD